MTGAGFTVITAVSEVSQPLIFPVAVTIYEVVTKGVATTAGPVVTSNPAAGAQSKLV
jgi:hypothetical protein